MQPMQWQEQKCTSLSLLNSTKETNAIEKYERKNQEDKIYLQNLDSMILFT
jgi:hypothetical protein